MGHAFFIRKGTMKKENKAMLEMLLCAALWSIAGIFMKFLPWNGLAVASLRSLLAGLTIAIYMVLSNRRFVIEKKTLLSGILTGCVYTCFACANKLTTAANAIVLQFTSPVFIVIFSALFFRKKIKRADLITVLITLGGIALFFFDRLETGYLFGNLVAIAAGMFMAGMYMAVGNLEGDERFTAITIGQAFTFLVGLPAVIATKPVFNLTTVSCIAVLGVFQLGISYILYVKASLYCPPLACCLLGGLEPLLNPVWVLLFYGEKPGIFALVGGIVVVVTITVWCALGSREQEAIRES